tara:strand:+ start:740 stop:4447 length:3708 start_codon:yes stop_codon:yes gene_type:complete
MTSSEKISFTYNQSIDLVTKELENTKIGQDAGTNITGERNIILGKDTAFNCIDLNDSVIIGYRYGFNLLNSSSNLIYIINNGIGGDERLLSDNNSILIGSLVGSKLVYNNNNNIIGFNCINNIESNISNNIINGSFIGNKLISAFNNTIIGNNNLEQAKNANNNIYIGMCNLNMDIDQNNLCIIGNNNKIKNDPLVIGNSNEINTINSIIMGNNLESKDILRGVNHLNNYDIILNNNLKVSLNLSNLIVSPIENNYIYISPYNPLELSLNNDLNLKKVEVKLDIFENIKKDNSFMYDVVYELDEYNVYNFLEPIVIYTTFLNTNKINLQYNNMKKNYKIYIKELPKYSHVNKRLYNYNESIILEPYVEYLNIKQDNFVVQIVININDVYYLAKKSYNIKVIRETIKDNYVLKEIYGNYISLSWFKDVNSLVIDKYDSVVLINNKNIYVKKFRLEENKIYWDNEIYNLDYNPNNLIVNGNNIRINDIDIKINNITELYNTRINTEWYRFSHSLYYVGYNIFDDYIYIEIPPKNGVIYNNLIKITDLLLKIIILEDLDDEMTIRVINKDKTKKSDKFKIILKNYTVNKINELSGSLVDDLYYVENNEIKNPNETNLLYYLNNCNINYIDNKINYEEQINTNINENIINIDIYPFNRINIYDELIKYGFLNIKKSNIFVLKYDIKNGYIDGIDYINSKNVDDTVNILIALNRYNYDEENVYIIKFNIINNYIFEYTSQYVYNDEELFKTFKVKDHLDSNILIYDGELDSLDKKNVSDKDFKVLFGNKIENINLNFYPTVSDFEVFYNEYWFRQDFSIMDINKENKIEYIFLDGINNYKITLDVLILLYEQFNIDKFKKFKFHIIINDIINYVYDETSGLKYNSVNKIIIENVDILYKFKIIYRLSENILSENENIINYFLKINFQNLLVEYNIDNGKNILYGQNIKCFGYDNIGLGSLYNLYGNNSVVIGNKIGNDFINNSIIVGNNSFNNVIARNIISIGNNNYNNINDNVLFDKLCSKNPIIIGNNIDFNGNELLNINNVIIETEEDIIIGKNLIISNLRLYKDDKLFAYIDSDIGSNFIGQHVIENDFINIFVGGYIVSSINEKKIKLSDMEKDQSVFGVIGDKNLSLIKMVNNNELIINVIGIGNIWVSNYNGNLKVGDLITTCYIPGIGMKQDDDIIHSYTVAKIRIDCNFEGDIKYIRLNGDIIDKRIYDNEILNNKKVYKICYVACTYHCG